MNTWTKKQYEQFSGASYDEPKKLAIDILFHTGMRLGELLALTPTDILPDMHIDVNKTYVTANGEEVLIPPKTQNSKRCIPIPKSLYCEIQKYISAYGIKEDCQIFSFTKTALQSYINMISKKEGLPPMNIHAFRHAHIKSLRLKGLPSSKTAVLLGFKKDVE